jgi:hypothetical protein
MRSNLTANPIATWDDLQAAPLYYRIPHGVAEKKNEHNTGEGDHGITYAALEACSQGYLPDYAETFNTLSDSQKRLHKMQNVIPTTGTESAYPVVQDGDIYSSASTSTELTLTFKNGSLQSTEHEIIWGTFKADQSFDSNPILWKTTVLKFTSSGTTCTVYGTVLIREESTGNDVAQGLFSCSAPSSGTVSDLRLPTQLTVTKGEYYQVVLSVYAVRTPSVINPASESSPEIETQAVITPVTPVDPVIPVDPKPIVPVNPIIPAVTVANITFYGGTPTIVFTHADKCVPYKDLKANTNVTVPVYISITNKMVSDTNKGHLEFIYHYKETASSAWQSMHGYTANWGEIPTSDIYKTIQVQINPLGKDVYADYLEIKLLFASSNKTMSFQINWDGAYYDGDSGKYNSWGRTFNKTAAESGGRYYAYCLSHITEIYTTINYY